jgi:ubiquinone/menaquinone biosynthesis C-methylase UbiE
MAATYNSIPALMSETGMAGDRRFGGLERFDNVDATGEQAMFFAFLDRVEVLPDVVRRRQRSYDLLRLQSGQRAVDVGCGLGTATRDIAARIAPEGQAIGIDLSAAMIAEARRRAAALGVAATFQEASVDALPVGTGTIQAYRAERLYQHLPNVAVALAEARRVLAAGGRIVLIDQDWDVAVLDADDLEISREIHRAFCNSLVQGTIGRRFRCLLLDAGFVEVQVQAETVTSANAEEYGFVVNLLDKAARASGVDAKRLDAWVLDQTGRVSSDRFFMVMTHFIASATQPKY